MEANYDDDSSSETDVEEFHNIKMSNKCLDTIATRDETFTTVNVRYPGRKSVKLLRLTQERKAMRCEPSDKCMGTLTQGRPLHL